ncbi:cysteine proteinase [Lepidopterella palustris CBS 459.81]|uniref:Cysteine proteinase n=1 Tax=Lepidopterella palustris CBS 459.81 TaxID=1314670 RepID=A0A8E2J8V2_9PEZI|nr:cysteine proteinase [Lepidopterella palustris CBS 459.81]
MPPPSPAYTPHQLSTYLSHISLPPATHPPSLTLPYLSRLLVHQLSAVPYENLSLHYSPVKRIDLSPAALYKKFITDGRGRGGYCMEVGIFFNHVLRGLGFEAYMTGVRIRPREGGVPGGSYMGW